MPFSSTSIVAGGSAGLQTAATHSVDVTAAAQVYASITVPAAGWYDVEVSSYAAVVGALGTDDYNVGLYSDPVTAASMVAQRLIPFNVFVPTAANSIAPPIRTRVYAQSTITLQSLAAGTSTCVYVCNMAVMPARGDEGDV